MKNARGLILIVLILPSLLSACSTIKKTDDVYFNTPGGEQSGKTNDPCLNIPKEELSGWYKKDYCYINLMKKTGDYELCEKVTGEGVGPRHDKNYCYIQAVSTFLDTNLCEKLDKNETLNQDWCYYIIAINKNDVKLCEKIIGNKFKSECLKIDESKKNLIDCNNLFNSSEKKECELNIKNVEKYEVQGPGMWPNYKDSDILYINKIIKQYSRGDVVLIQFTDNIQTSLERIIGLPGESVKVDNGKIFIYNNNNTDGYILDEKYLPEPEDKKTFSKNNNTIKLGADEYYVLGDNRIVSKDSRTIGPVNKSYIKGMAMKTTINK